MLGMFLAALDQTIVGPVLPRIVTELKGADYYTWVVTIYLLTSTITVPFYGKLSDLYGRKPMMMIGVTIFLIGSALSGPALGGLLTDNVSWHWIFYVNIPVGLVSLVVLARLLPTVKRAGATRNFDI